MKTILMRYCAIHLREKNWMFWQTICRKSCTCQFQMSGEWGGHCYLLIMMSINILISIIIMTRILIATVISVKTPLPSAIVK